MNLEKLFEQVFNDPNNIRIEYSNINGKEKLIINGKEIEEDNTEIKNKVEKFKEIVSSLDDSVFEELVDGVEDIESMNSELESCTENSEKIIKELSIIIKNILYNRIKDYKSIIEKLAV